MRGTGIMPLHFAAMTGRVDLVEALLNLGAPLASKIKQDVPQHTIVKGWPPLAFAAIYARDGAFIKLLLRRGADPRRAAKRPLFEDSVAARTAVGGSGRRGSRTRPRTYK